MNRVSELNKLKVQLFVEAVSNEGRLELIDELVAADYVGHFACAGLDVAGPEGVRRLGASRRRADPGLYIKIADQVAEDDRVVTCWQATTASPDARAAGRAACYAGVPVIRLLAGKQVDSRTEMHRATSGTIRGSAEDMKTRSSGLTRCPPLGAISLPMRRDLPDRSRRSRAT